MFDLQVRAIKLPFGIMVWWNECEEAASYQIKLYLSSGCRQKLCVINVDRNMLYHTFTGLAKSNYAIEVLAENREGEIFASGQKLAKVDNVVEISGCVDTGNMVY